MPYHSFIASALVLATLSPSYSESPPNTPRYNDQVHIPTSQPALHNYYYHENQSQPYAYEDTLKPESGVEEPPKPDTEDSDTNYMYYYY